MRHWRRGLLACGIVLVLSAPLFAQVTPVPVTAVPTPQNHIPETVGWGLVVSYLYQWAKNSKRIPLFDHEWTRATQARVGAIIAVLSAVGIHFSITGDFLDSAGPGATLTITGLTFNSVKDVALAWASQQAWYDLVVHKRTPPSAS